jgi:hypothetical protein
MTHRLLLLTLVVAGSLTPALALDREPANRVSLDMARGWQRRDWQRCQDPTRVTFADGVIAFDSPGASALLWQVPTLEGPARIDATTRWARECDRPPFAVLRGMAERGDVPLIALGERPVLSWRWKVDRLAADSATLGPGGKVRREGNDFAAQVGVLIAEEGSDDVHEIGYVWTRTLPRETLLYQEATFLLRKVRSYRIVVETGEERRRRWVDEERDLAADFARIFPGRRPGRVLRVYLMTDSDDTAGRTAASYAGLAFLPRH